MSRQEQDSEMHLLTEAAAQVTEMKIRVGLNSYLSLIAFSIESYLNKHNNLTNIIWYLSYILHCNVKSVIYGPGLCLEHLKHMCTFIFL